MAMKFSRLGLIVLLGVIGSIFAPLAFESSLFSVSPVVAQTNQERKEEADRLLKKGYQQYQAGQFQESLQLFQQALTIYQDIGERRWEAVSLIGIGVVYESLYQHEEVINHYKQSLAMFQEIGEQKLTGYLMQSLGNAYYKLGQYEKAIYYNQQSLAIKEEIEDKEGIADSLNNLGLVYRSMGQYEKAIYYNQQSLAIKEEIGHKEGIADSLNNLGLVYENLGQYEKAIYYYQQSLVIQQEIGDKEGIAYSLNNLGLVYENLGQYEKAIYYYQQSLVIFQEIGHKKGIAYSFNNLGNVYNYWRQYKTAIDYYQRSLDLKEEIGDKEGLASSLSSMGNVYYDLGQYEKAIDYEQQSLTIFQEIGYKEGIANSSNNLSVFYYKLGQYEKAIDYEQQSLTIFQEIGYKEGIANSLNNLGLVYEHLGQYEKAIYYHQQSLAIKEEIGHKEGIADSLNNLGNVYNYWRQYEKAIDYYQKDLAIDREIGDKEGIAVSLNNLGYSLFKSGNLTAAENNLIEAMEMWESLRVGLLDEQKISIFDTQTSTYRLLQQVFTAQNKTNQALEISERGRARALVELLVKRFSSSQEEQSPQYPQIAEIKQIAQQQNATLVQYSVVENQIYIWVISPQGKIDFFDVDIPEDTTLKELVNQGLRCTISRECRSGETSTNELPSTYSRGDLVKLNKEKQGDLQEPWEVISFNAQTGILTLTHPQFGEGTVVTHSQEDVIELVDSPHIQKQNLQKLHQLLIAPIKQFLPEDENDHVIFIPHQELFGVPFPALQDEQGTYLIKHHTILTAPSIQALQLTNQRRNALGNKDLSQSEFLIVGNPDMPNNPELPGENVKLTPLPHSETEANNIASQFNSQALIGLVATETTVVEKMKTADIIHLATHGLVQDNYTGGSIPGAIALSEDNINDGLLTADELFQLENQLQAQLVVLSACDTGRGAITGDGIIGLSRSLIAAGTPSILVSLWKVPDESTGELMVRFYEHLEASGNKAQALRQAMLETMEERPFPRDWAAFTLIGEAF